MSCTSEIPHTPYFRQLKEEVQVLVQLDHPNIVRLEEVYESKAEIYLVFERLSGGELFDRLDEQPDYHYTEAVCRDILQQVLCSIRYCHSKGIIHRDLKLENFIFENHDEGESRASLEANRETSRVTTSCRRCIFMRQSAVPILPIICLHLELGGRFLRISIPSPMIPACSSAGSKLKLIDFGLSKHFEHGEVQHDAVGTPYTVAPEVIRGTYDAKCDIWAVGVITYLLLSGETPFGGCGGEALTTVRNNILAGVVTFEPEYIWREASQEAKSFIKSLLQTDPRLRPTATEALRHPWFDSPPSSASSNVLSASVVQSLVQFKSYNNLRKLICEIISFTLLQEQIQGLRVEFEKVDKDGIGEISFETLKFVLEASAKAGNMGSLQEDEIVSIFNSLKVSKKASTIHYHEVTVASREVTS